MTNIFDLLGLDETDLEWQDLALCKDWDIRKSDDFYDEYESNERVAKAVDQACLSCPVIKQCLQMGIDNSEWGVWGGIYLTAGRPDKNRNAHKTPQVWKQLKERIGAQT